MGMSYMQAQTELRRTNSRLGESREYAPVPNSDAAGVNEINEAEGLQNLFGDHKILTSMLLFVPCGFASFYLEWPPQAVFGLNFLAVIPLAWLIGKSTEDLAASVGETLGGLLNATFGNVVEMLLCVNGIRNNEIIVVQCTLLGSILSNLLLVLGGSFFVGGLFYKTLDFCQQGAATQCSLLAMSVFAIGLPTIYVTILHQDQEWEHMVAVSRWAAIFLLLTYFAYLWFQLKTHRDLFEPEGEHGEEEQPDLTPCIASVLLGITTVTTAFATHFLIHSIRGTVDVWQVSEEFIGIIMLPIIGNAAEHYTAIVVASKNKLDLSLGVAAGSSCQMALLVTPFTVLCGWFYDIEMTLDFHSFQLVVLLLSVFLATTILQNGKSNWLEGMMLLVTYLVCALIYFFEGASKATSLATLN